MLILRHHPASPYARKVRIAAAQLGLADRLELSITDTTDPANPIRAQNPLGKIPTLLLDDGTALYDSRVIVAYLDHLAGGTALIPSDTARRFAALRLEALGDGICDAALLIRYEQTARPEAQRSASWVELQQGKIDRALAALEAAPPPAPRDIGQVAIACALGYLDLRFDGAWRAGAPKLVAWLDAFARETPAFEATKA
jgi:glutathione S-transferase